MSTVFSLSRVASIEQQIQQYMHQRELADCRLQEARRELKALKAMQKIRERKTRAGQKREGVEG